MLQQVCRVCGSAGHFQRDCPEQVRTRKHFGLNSCLFICSLPQRHPCNICGATDHEDADCTGRKLLCPNSPQRTRRPPAYDRKRARPASENRSL